MLFLVVQSINGSTLYAGGEDYAVTGDAVINLDTEAETRACPLASGQVRSGQVYYSARAEV